LIYVAGAFQRNLKRSDSAASDIRFPRSRIEKTPDNY
jgi:hypothetical protein